MGGTQPHHLEQKAAETYQAEEDSRAAHESRLSVTVGGDGFETPLTDSLRLML
jgi:hypothetical protein